MACITFVSRTFSAKSKALINYANDIVAEYMAQGFRLTLRQLYYQFVSRDLIPNKQKEYKRLGSVINDARLAGLIDWDAIEDRGRNLQSRPTWDNPDSIISACATQYRIDLWADQPFRPEVWIEKEALAGVIQPTCEELRVSYIACKGYMSQSEMFEAGYTRFRDYQKKDQIPVLLHLGDHDPSGLDMTRDITDRMRMFFGAKVEVCRLALNMDQVEEYNPPPNPAKTTDVRFTEYEKQFGTESWELDALDPKTIAALVRLAVLARRDSKLWKVAEKREVKDRQMLQQIADRMVDVREFLTE